MRPTGTRSRLALAGFCLGLLTLGGPALGQPAGDGSTAAALGHGGGMACPMMGGSPLPARAALGISIADPAAAAPDKVRGVTVAAVLPGGGAEDAGLEVGDLLTAVNGQSLAADSAGEANRRLVRFMDSVNAGEEVQLDYERDGRGGSVRVEARPLPPALVMGMPPGHRFPGPRPGMGGPGGRSMAGSFQGIRLTEITPGLGRYFGAEDGVLVLRAPAAGEIPLREGDVILEISGRKPGNRRHALQILGSYAAGEEISLKILRDKGGQTLKFTVPRG